MKYKPLMFAALVPLLATAGEGGALQSKVDVQKLKEDVRVSEVIGAEVKMQSGTQTSAQGGGQEGQEAGQVEDVLIAGDGSIEAVLIDGMDSSQGDGGGQQDDQRVSTSQGAAGGGEQSQSVGTVTDDGLTKVQWDQVSYDPAAETVSLTPGSAGSGMQSSAPMDTGASGMQTSADAGSAQGGMTSADTTSGSAAASGQSAAGGDSFKASELIGMEVHLSDAKSFGEVGDVLINEQEGKASALVVNAWEGLDRQTYALPVELQAVNREDDAIDYSYTESDVIALQEYEDE